MKIKHNVDLKDYTTIKIGGECKNLYFPETTEDILEIIAEHAEAKILGGGSNLLINDCAVFDHVICLREFEKEKIDFGDSTVTVGSGVRLQKLIRTINEHGFGGVEYLYSVPGLVGGAIYMNAGRGRGANKQISDYIISVDVLEDGKVVPYTREECGFMYRYSVFHEKPSAIILRVVFKFDRVDLEEGIKRQKERLSTCKEFQDNRYPNAGTCFCKADHRIMALLKKCESKKETGVHYSVKASNWLQNRGNGSYKQAMKKIRLAKMLHLVLRKPCKLEYKVWD